MGEEVFGDARGDDYSTGVKEEENDLRGHHVFIIPNLTVKCRLHSDLDYHLRHPCLTASKRKLSPPLSKTYLRFK